MTSSRMRPLRTAAWAVLVCCALLPAPATLAARGAAGPRGAADPEQECPNDGLGDVVPGTASARGVTDAGQTVTLTVLVLLDGVSVAQAQQIVAGVQRAYEPLRIAVVPTYRRLSLAADGRAADGQPTAGFRRLLDEVRRRYPVPPKGFDTVHLLTSKDVVDDQDPSRDGTDELAGAASCIGGIRYEGHQLSLSEARFRYHRSGPDDVHVVGMTHEIAHLLGAHHHYGNCAEGRTRSVGSPGSCTVMFPLAVFNSAVFGTLEASVVRGYAVSYA